MPRVHASSQVESHAKASACRKDQQFFVNHLTNAFSVIVLLSAVAVSLSAGRQPHGQAPADLPGSLCRLTVCVILFSSWTTRFHALAFRTGRSDGASGCVHSNEAAAPVDAEADLAGPRVPPGERGQRMSRVGERTRGKDQGKLMKSPHAVTPGSQPCAPSETTFGAAGRIAVRPTSRSRAAQ